VKAKCRILLRVLVSVQTFYLKCDRRKPRRERCNEIPDSSSVSFAMARTFEEQAKGHSTLYRPEDIDIAIVQVSVPNPNLRNAEDTSAE
jgi:hypothetical protein